MRGSKHFCILKVDQDDRFEFVAPKHVAWIQIVVLHSDVDQALDAPFPQITKAPLGRISPRRRQDAIQLVPRLLPKQAERMIREQEERVAGAALLHPVEHVPHVVVVNRLVNAANTKHAAQDRNVKCNARLAIGGKKRCDDRKAFDRLSRRARLHRHPGNVLVDLMLLMQTSVRAGTQQAPSSESIA